MYAGALTVRNRFPGPCYRCSQIVAARDGHFERYKGGWRLQHWDCAIYWREKELNIDKPRFKENPRP